VRAHALPRLFGYLSHRCQIFGHTVSFLTAGMHSQTVARPTAKHSGHSPYYRDAPLRKALKKRKKKTLRCAGNLHVHSL